MDKMSFFVKGRQTSCLQRHICCIIWAVLVLTGSSVCCCSAFEPEGAFSGDSSGSPAGDRSVEAFTFQDALKKPVTVKVPARRIVVLNSDAAEILYILGASNRIVGIGSYMANSGTGLMPSLKGKPSVGSPQSPNLEAIVALKPDLVVSYEMWLSVSALEYKLEPLGIPVARIPCYRLGEMARDVQLLGRISGTESRAKAFLSDFENTIRMVGQRVGDVKPRARVYAEGYTELTTVSGGIGADMLLKKARAVNIASDLAAAYPRVSAEWVMAQNPDVVIKALGVNSMKTGYDADDGVPMAGIRQSLMNRPGWHLMKAVKQGRVHLISSEIWVGPRAPVGILYIAAWSYPDLFSDIDLEAFHDNWLKTWYGKNLKGVFVYP